MGGAADGAQPQAQVAIAIEKAVIAATKGKLAGSPQKPRTWRDAACRAWHPGAASALH
jgi:hypothetical protein